jgi:hypothetical protein
MKALTSLLAVLLLLSCTSLAQTAASTPSADAAAASPGAVPAAPSMSPFAPGAKVFLEPMDGFEQLLADSILHKKVPVVIVKEREKADFVMSGEAHVKKRGVVTGMVLSTHGGGSISIKDARKGDQVFAYSFHRVDAMERKGDIYLN